MEKLEKGFFMIPNEVLDKAIDSKVSWIVFERDHDPHYAMGKDFQKCQRCGGREELPYKFEPAIDAMHAFLDKHSKCESKK